MNGVSWNLVQAEREHIAPIAARMRPADKFEVWAMHQALPDEALSRSLLSSRLAWTCLVEDAPAFMWGVSGRGSILCDVGEPWLLGTDTISKVSFPFLRQSRLYVDAMQKPFRRLENYVYTGNDLSIRWLMWCGFSVERRPTIIHATPFYRFWREPCAA